MSKDLSDANIREICGMISRIQASIEQSVFFIETQINGILSNCVTDSGLIEHLLDTLLDYAGMNEDALVLFKRLCRYFYYINPNATAEYIYTYRDLYDFCID